MLRRLFGRWLGVARDDEPFLADLKAALQDARGDLEWMFPPATTSDPDAWDRHWQDQVRYGVGPLVNMFIDDGPLVDAMRANGLRSVLCVGSGISAEPLALALAGFEVTTLDLSPWAVARSERVGFRPEALDGLIGGRGRAEGGSLRGMAGDLRDLSLRPGPFDVVLDRKTLQLFSADERPAGMSAVAARLAPRGLFVSHCHDGAWRPGQAREAHTAPWFETEGWARYDGGPLAARAAWVFLMTG